MEKDDASLARWAAEQDPATAAPATS
jgi:hypothetical protein